MYHQNYLISYLKAMVGHLNSIKLKVTLLPLNIGYNILGSLGDIDFTVSSWATLAIRPSLPKNKTTYENP